MSLFTGVREFIGPLKIKYDGTGNPLTIVDNNEVVKFTVDSTGIVTGGSGIIPTYVVLTATVSGTAAATGTNYGRVFTADRAYQLVSATEVHRTAGNDGGAVTLALEKCTGTQAEGAGVLMMANTFNLKGTADTVQSATLSATAADSLLASGNRIVLLDTGTLATLADVCVTIVLKAV